jgi:lipopolysaccharide export LptBFGC system permease protein LptF
MTDRMTRQETAGEGAAEARSAAALILSVTAVIAAAIGLASLADGQGGLAIAAGMASAVSFVVSMFCFSADAEPVTGRTPAAD